MDECAIATCCGALPSRVDPTRLRTFRERGPMKPVARASTGSSWLAVVAMLGAVSLWGPSFVATKVALRDLPPLTIAFLRFLIASCVLYPVWRLSSHGAQLGRATHGRLFFGGVLGVTGYFILENLGVQRTTAGDAALLMAAIPVIVLLVEAAWLKQAVTRKRGAGVVLSFAGVFLLISGGRAVGGSHRLLGDLLVMAAAFLWAAYSLLGRTVNSVPKLAVVTYQAVYGTVMLVPFALLEQSQWHLVSPHSALAVVYLGVMCSAATYLLYNYALKTLAASQVTAFLNLVPVIGAAAAVLILSERLHLTQVLGGGVILLGVVMSTRAQSVRLPSLVRRAVGTRRVRKVAEAIRLQDSEGGATWIISEKRFEPTTPEGAAIEPR